MLTAKPANCYLTQQDPNSDDYVVVTDTGELLTLRRSFISGAVKSKHRNLGQNERSLQMCCHDLTVCVLIRLRDINLTGLSPTQFALIFARFDDRVKAVSVKFSPLQDMKLPYVSAPSIP